MGVKAWHKTGISPSYHIWSTQIGFQVCRFLKIDFRHFGNLSLLSSNVYQLPFAQLLPSPLLRIVLEDEIMTLRPTELCVKSMNKWSFGPQDMEFFYLSYLEEKETWQLQWQSMWTLYTFWTLEQSGGPSFSLPNWWMWVHQSNNPCYIEVFSYPFLRLLL